MPALITLSQTGRATLSCGATCYNAKVSPCHCICMGLNHGVSREAAIERTRRDGLHAVNAYKNVHPETATWQVRFHLPPIPINQPLPF